jgi:hypothetical protein
MTSPQRSPVFSRALQTWVSREREPPEETPVHWRYLRSLTLPAHGSVKCLASPHRPGIMQRFARASGSPGTEKSMSTDFTDRPYPYPDRPPPPRSSNTALIVLAVVGGTMLLCGGCVVVCITAIATLGSNANGTFTYVATKVSASGTDNSGPEKVADRFIQEISLLQFDAAYNRTTTGFQRTHSKGRFQALFKSYPALMQQLSHSVLTRNFAANSATITYRVNGVDPTGEPVDVELRLTQEAGSWKIDEINID